MIKEIKNAVVLPVAFIAVITGSATQTVRAGVLDNLVEAANNALPQYGREGTTRSNRLDLTSAEISAAIREALKLAAENVALRLRSDSYNQPNYRVSLPPAWKKAQKIASRVGYGAKFEKLEQQMNSAALAAVPATRTLIKRLVDRLEFENPHAILGGHDIAATQHLRQRINGQLARRLKPIINDLLVETGATDESDRIARRVERMPMVRNLRTDLADHVVAQSLDGFFNYMEKEEQAIRIHPESRTSALLQRVFG